MYEHRLDCQELDDAAVYAKRSNAWQEAANRHGGIHPKVHPIANGLLKRMRASARPALQGGGMAVE